MSETSVPASNDVLQRRLRAVTGRLRDEYAGARDRRRRGVRAIRAEISNHVLDLLKELL